MDLLLLLVAFVVILAGAELFTNGIEWFGKKLELAEGAVGSVLAAVGTALPETMIPIIAILFAGGAGSHEVGVGAILGAPFMLSTLAMFVTGVAVLLVARRGRPNDVMLVNTRVLWHDMKFFAIAYAIAVGVAFLPGDLAWPRWLAAGVLLLIYAYYVREHFQADAGHDGGGDLAVLRFHRLDRWADHHPAPPRLRIVTVQVLFALGCIVVGATVFVGAVEHLALSFGLDEVLLALVIAPIAFNAKERLNACSTPRDRLVCRSARSRWVTRRKRSISLCCALTSRSWASVTSRFRRTGSLARVMNARAIAALSRCESSGSPCRVRNRISLPSPIGTACTMRCRDLPRSGTPTSRAMRSRNGSAVIATTADGAWAYMPRLGDGA